QRLISMEERFGPLPDYDVTIERRGGDVNTEYNPYREDAVEIPGLFPNMACPKCGHKARIGQGYPGARCPNDETPLEGEPGVYDRYVPDIEAMLMRFGSKEFYDWHFRGANSNDAQQPRPQQTAPTDLEQSELDRLRAERDRIAAH